MAQKVCPRCGAQYATLKSATCPQCFAKLVEVDDETAAEMAAARAAVERSPEYRQAKEEEDERYRHQSFQACLGVAAMGIALVVLAVVLIATKWRHEHRAASSTGAVVRQAAAPATVATRPEDVMPARAGAFRREKLDPPAALSGTVTLIYHAAYLPAQPEPGTPSTIDVYAVAVDRPAAELARFRDVVQLAALAGAGQRSVREVKARPFLYEIVGAPGKSADNEEFRQAWAKQVGGV